MTSLKGKKFSRHNGLELSGCNMGIGTQIFFHHKASQRRQRNWIDTILDDHRERFTEEEDIANVFTSLFQDLFSSSEPNRIAEAVQVVNRRINNNMRRILDVEFTKEEIRDSLKSMKPIAAPGPDGMPAIFSRDFGILWKMT